MHTHPWPEPREGRHCFPDQTDWLVNDIYLEGTREAIEREQERGHDWYVPLNGVTWGMGGGYA